MAGKTEPAGPISQPRTTSLSAIAIGLWVVLVAVLAYVWLKPSRPQPDTRALALMVSQRISDLGIKPKRVQLPTDLSLDETLAIKRGDYREANRIAEGVLGHRTSFQPFNDFMYDIVRYEDPVLLQHLDDWIAHDPHSAVAHLTRGVYFDVVAWIARGGDYASKVSARQMYQFEQDMAKARDDFQTAVDLDPNLPWSHYELLNVVSSGGAPDEAERIFQAAVQRFPGYYPLYRERLRELTPKWYGSVEKMYDLIDTYARPAPSNSPLKFLYLELYVNLLDDAGAACSSVEGDAKQSCVDSALEKVTRPELSPGVLEALKLYSTSDPVQFTAALWPLLGEIACNRCYSPASSSSEVLQAAASIMGSDTRMMDNPAHNNYMLDDITARVWAQMGNSANADQKFREALNDVERTSFRDEAEKAVALATIFDHMAQFADDTSQFIDEIVYNEAEKEVGGSNFSNAPYRACYAYYRMRYFEAAVKECSALIDGNGNYLLTHYWRGKAYEGLRKWDASIADLSPVAEMGNNWFRVGAALDMAYDLHQKGDRAAELALLNEHTWLFDPNLQPPHDLAVAYNDRCATYMDLGQLQKALDDCTTSLTYDRLPDALRKEQELLKRLGKQATASSPGPLPRPGKTAAIPSI